MLDVVDNFVEVNTKSLIDNAEYDYTVMLKLLELKNNSLALFMGHKVLAGYLKAILEKNNKEIPKTENLVELAILTKIPFFSEQMDFFEVITTFNSSAIYNSYKRAFNKKCTLYYTSKWMKNIEDSRILLLQFL